MSDRAVASSSGGPLGRRVLEYTEVMQRLVPTVAAPADWEPLAEFVAVDQFTRVGTFMECHAWDQYLQMLTQWASSVDAFETTPRRVNEIGNLVYFEIEERHHRASDVHVVNTMTVFAFDDDRRIQRLDVYLQQPR